jgi:hypothetical protein
MVYVRFHIHGILHVVCSNLNRSTRVGLYQISVRTVTNTLKHKEYAAGRDCMPFYLTVELASVNVTVLTDIHKN